jgi:hypothetical protein
LLIELWLKNAVLLQVERNIAENKVNGRIKKITVERGEDSFQAQVVSLPSTSLSMGKAGKEISEKRLSPRYSQFMIFTIVILIRSWMNNQFQEKVVLLCGDGKWLPSCSCSQVHLFVPLMQGVNSPLQMDCSDFNKRKVTFHQC